MRSLSYCKEHWRRDKSAVKCQKSTAAQDLGCNGSEVKGKILDVWLMSFFFVSEKKALVLLWHWTADWTVCLSPPAGSPVTSTPAPRPLCTGTAGPASPWPPPPSSSRTPPASQAGSNWWWWLDLWIFISVHQSSISYSVEYNLSLIHHLRLEIYQFEDRRTLRTSRCVLVMFVCNCL